MARKQHRQWFLKQWRKHRGLTQDQLAERVGLSTPYLSQLETGKRQYTQELLEAFADELRTDVASLVMRNPSDPEGLWSIWDGLTPTQREIGTRLLAALKADKTGTGN